MRPEFVIQAENAPGTAEPKSCPMPDALSDQIICLPQRSQKRLNGFPDS